MKTAASFTNPPHHHRPRAGSGIKERRRGGGREKKIRMKNRSIRGNVALFDVSTNAAAHQASYNSKCVPPYLHTWMMMMIDYDRLHFKWFDLY